MLVLETVLVMETCAYNRGYTVHTNSSKLFHIVILHLKALFEYALLPAVFDGTVR